MQDEKKNLYVLAALATLLLVFYPDLFLAKSASLAGDHLVQHYPWAQLLANRSKHFELPFWTPLIHCGFPIAAEGQIGVFYLPNLILFLLLPFRWAYSYLNLFHFLLSGYGTYLYARQMKLSFLAAFVSAFIFLFGTAYGGAYYNITSLKTISWFPLTLYLFERFLEVSKWRYLFFLSLTISSALLAGYLQVAVYVIGIFFLYAGLRIFIFHGDRKVNLPQTGWRTFGLSVATLLGFLIALPQVLLTFELAIRSNRLAPSEEYAYVGSMFPFALSTLVYPLAQGLFRGNSIYSGVFSVLLILFGIYSKETREKNAFRIWIVMGFLSLFLALGEWSPFYIGLIKLTKFYSFRTPAKFLVFICF
ncbi:MAG: hypothetical protein HY351_04200, partial [Candidatus Omnitrophica bacterium]|nr:hypothetical protein [Candidatus Omnitrophota bacterium]